MAEELILDRGTTALLVMDYQVGVVERYTDSDGALLGRMASVVRAARATGIQVIYVTINFRQGYPEVSPRNRGFSALPGSGWLLAGSREADVHPAVAPAPEDIVVVKKRVGAYAGSDLQLILSSRGIQTLVLAGISTSGVVLSTIRWAFDMDYNLVVLADCCADKDPEVHRVLTEKVYPGQATVIASEAFLQSLRSSETF